MSLTSLPRRLPALDAARRAAWRPALVAVLVALLLHALLLALLPLGVGAGFDGGVQAWMQARQIVLAPPVVAAPDTPAPPRRAARAERAPAAAAPAAEAAPEAPAPAEPTSAEPSGAEGAAAPDAAASAVARTAEPSPPIAPEAGGQAVPTFATRMAPAAVLRFELRRGTLTGEAELVWQPRADGYAVVMHASVFGSPLLNWSSQGGFDTNGLAPERFVDRRRRDVRAASFQRDKGMITFSGPPIAYPLLPGSQDRLSWMLQLPAIIQAAPAQFAPGARIPLFVSGARGDADLWTFTVEDVETVDVAGGRVQGALRLLREPRRPFDTRVEVWLDPARHHLPVRLRLTQPQSGDSNEFVLREMDFVS